MQVIADFSGSPDRARTDVGDGVVGPAGVVTLSLDGLDLEFDRADGRILAVELDSASLRDSPPPPWRPILPDTGGLGAAASPVAIELPTDDFLVAAHRIARIDTELLDAEPEGRAVLVRTAAMFEVVPLIATVQQALPGLYGGRSGLEAIGQRAQEAFRALDDGQQGRLNSPDLKGDLFRLLVDKAAGVVETIRPLLDQLGGRPELHPDLLPSAMTSTTEQPLLVTRGSQSSGESRIAADGTFSLSSEMSPDLIRGRLSADRAVCRVHVDGFERTADDDRGPVWVRAFAGGHVVAGGPVAVGPDGHGYTADFPMAGTTPPDAIEVGLNPYRVGDQPRPISSYATDALVLARTALAWSWPAPDDRRWRRVAEAWLAAGFLDRAALAYSYASDPQSAVWVRSAAAQARLASHPTLWQPDSLAWLRP
jgi:hypothetical protein